MKVLDVVTGSAPQARPTLVLVATGSAYLLAVLVLVISRTPLGSPLFFAIVAIMALAFALTLANAGRLPAARPRLLLGAFAFALAFRIPLALAPVGADNDMIRYLWDGRVQRLGLNPYLVVPADPAMGVTHTPETATMPSRRARTPYPPAAQLFFRMVVSVKDSALAMKLAIVGCDLLTIIVLWRWLTVTGRNEWLALAYAWNPLVVIEAAHSGHIDAVGAMWLAASAYWLARRRTLLSTIAFVLAVATKLLPIVLAPLYVGRIRARDAILGAALMAALYLQFTEHATLPFGAVPSVVAHIRFNGPLFRALAWISTPQVAAAIAVLLGLVAAVVARWKLPGTHPAAWAWPMAISLASAPVVYPWYLLYIAPFLYVRETLPLLAWNFSALSTYVVWNISRHGGSWIVPGWVMVLEYALPMGIALILASRKDRDRIPGNKYHPASH
jgi:alpha-1,6-mannosyltransferase